MFVSFCEKDGDGTSFYQVQANMAMLDKDFELAEGHYTEQVSHTT